MTKFEISWLEDRSDAAVLAEIRRVAALFPNQRLTVNKFDSRSRIKSTAVRERFGSWSEASRKAGLSQALPDYSDVAIIEDLRRVSESVPYEPFTSAFYSTHGRYSNSCIKRRFGGWREALSAAGIGGRFTGPTTTDRMKKQMGRATSNEAILDELRAISARLGNAPLAGADIVANSKITQSLLFRRFGSISAALRQAGLKQVNHGRRHTEDEVFKNLLEVWTHYGRAPTALEMDRPPSAVGKSTYLNRFGGWRKALKAFVERANREADGETFVTPKHEAAVPVVRPSFEARVFDTGRPGEPGRGVEAPGARRAKAKLNPEDQRKPSDGLRFKVLERDKYRCQTCGRGPPAKDHDCVLVLDHIKPWSKGGRTTFENLRTLCSICNRGRGNRFDN